MLLFFDLFSLILFLVFLSSCKNILLNKNNFYHVNENIILLDLPFVESFPNNVFFFKSIQENEYVLFDAGCEDNLNDFLDFFDRHDEHGVLPDRIKYIIISHVHYDHIGCVSFLKKRNPDLKVIVPSQEIEYIETCSLSPCEDYPFHLPSNIRKYIKELNDEFSKANLSYDSSFLLTQNEEEVLLYPEEFSQKIEKELQEDFGLQIFNLPGHSLGLLALKWEKGNDDERRSIFFTSDLLFEGRRKKNDQNNMMTIEDDDDSLWFFYMFQNEEYNNNDNKKHEICSLYLQSIEKLNNLSESENDIFFGAHLRHGEKKSKKIVERKVKDIEIVQKCEMVVVDDLGRDL